jgi:Transposase DDE domain
VSKIGVATRTLSPEALVDADLDTLVTALYVRIDDMLVKDRRPGHPARLSQPELVCLAVAQALLGFHSEHRWIRFAICHLRGAFPYLPHQPGYNKRLRAALPLVKQVIRDLAADSDFWFDNVWIADSTPVECARSRPAVQRSQMAGWANYGYCASHSRWFWGLRLYLICTPAGMPILWALADPKIGEREVLAAMLDVEPPLAAARPGLALITDKGFAGRETEADLGWRGITLLRPSRKDEAARHGEPLLKSIRQLIESVNDTLKGQLDLESHGGRTFEGVAIRVAQRILAMAAAIWHNNKTGAPLTRSLIAYDH